MHTNASRRAALVLDAHCNAGLCTVQSLGRAGIAVDVASETPCLAQQSVYARNRFRQPSPADPDAFLKWLNDVSGTSEYSLVVPATEKSLACVMKLPEGSAIRRVSQLPSNASLNVALSKRQTVELADSLGIPVPRSRHIRQDQAPTLPTQFPLVLKPTTSVVRKHGEIHGLRPLIARDAQSWQTALDTILPFSDLIEQEYATGHGFGIECLYSHGRRQWHFQHERIHELPLTGGASSYRRSTTPNPALLDYATRLLDALEWHGVAMVEFRGSAESGYRLMEINPRLWGSLPLPVAAGIDFPLGLWQLATQPAVAPQPSITLNHYARNLESDLWWHRENLTADKDDPLLLTRPVGRSALELLRPFTGRETWDNCHWRDWRVTLKILARGINTQLRSVISRLRRPVGGSKLSASR